MNMYKKCHSCKTARETDLALAVGCSSCKGTGIVRDHASYQCNACGGSMAPEAEAGGDTSPYGLVEARVCGAFNSYHFTDLTSYTFSVCEGCLRKLFDGFKVPPETDSYGEGSFTYAQDLEYYRYRLWKRNGGQTAAKSAGLCMSSEHCKEAARWAFMSQPSSEVFGAEDLDPSYIVCDAHVPDHLNSISYRCIPVEAVPKDPVTPNKLSVFRYAMDTAPYQFPSRHYTEEQMQLLCRETLGDKWEEWAAIKIPTMGNRSPNELLDEGFASWVYLLIKVFAQRGEIPYLNSATG